MLGYNCVIVDDSELDRLSLSAMLKRFPQFRVLGSFSSPQKALEIVNEIGVDVLFLDIEMPGLSGIELRRKLQSIPVCIFISYSQKFAVESFELETLDYLVKPLKFDRFEKTVARIENQISLHRQSLEKKTDNTIFIKNGTQQIRLNLDEVKYLEAQKDYTRIVSISGKEMILSTLGATLETEPFKNFIRIHRSYAVPLHLIYKVNNHSVVLEDGTSLPVGRTYREKLVEIL